MVTKSTPFSGYDKTNEDDVGGEHASGSTGLLYAMVRYG